MLFVIAAGARRIGSCSLFDRLENGLEITDHALDVQLKDLLSAVAALAASNELLGQVTASEVHLAHVLQRDEALVLPLRHQFVANVLHEHVLAHDSLVLPEIVL